MAAVTFEDARMTGRSHEGGHEGVGGETASPISSPGAILFSAELYAVGDDLVVVEADGFGRATTSVVVGNYPTDYFTKSEKVFGSEGEALAAAEEIVEGRRSPALALAGA